MKDERLLLCEELAKTEWTRKQLTDQLNEQLGEGVLTYAMTTSDEQRDWHVVVRSFTGNEPAIDLLRYYPEEKTQ